MLQTYTRGFWTAETVHAAGVPGKYIVTLSYDDPSDAFPALPIYNKGFFDDSAAARYLNLAIKDIKMYTEEDGSDSTTGTQFVTEVRAAEAERIQKHQEKRRLAAAKRAALKQAQLEHGELLRNLYRQMIEAGDMAEAKYFAYNWRKADFATKFEAKFPNSQYADDAANLVMTYPS